MIFRPDSEFSGSQFYVQPLTGCWKPEPYCEIGMPPILSQRIERGLKKLHAGELLTFDESDAFNIFWHQLLHSLGDQDFSDYETDVRRQFEIEVVNEMHARLTLAEFIHQIGYDPYFVAVDTVRVLGSYYERWIRPMRHILEAIGMGHDEARTFFERLNYERPTRTYLSEITKLIADRLQFGEADSNDLRKRLISELERTGEILEVERFVLAEAKKLNIKPTML